MALHPVRHTYYATKSFGSIIIADKGASSGGNIKTVFSSMQVDMKQTHSSHLKVSEETIYSFWFMVKDQPMANFAISNHSLIVV